MPENDGSATPQVGNAGSGTGGATPQVGNGAPTVTPQVGNSGSGNPPQPQLTLEQALDALAKTRKENDRARKTEKELRAELKKFSDDQLSKKQKRQQDKTDAQTHAIELEARVQRLSLENAGHQLALTLGIADVRAALALVRAEHEHEIDYDEQTQQPKNLAALLRDVLTAHPILGAHATNGQQNGQANDQQNGQPARPAANSGGATNPGVGARAIPLTREIIEAMTPEQRVANVDLINMWLAAGGH